MKIFLSVGLDLNLAGSYTVGLKKAGHCQGDSQRVSGHVDGAQRGLALYSSLLACTLLFHS